MSVVAAATYRSNQFASRSSGDGGGSDGSGAASRIPCLRWPMVAIWVFAQYANTVYKNIRTFW
ncbi:uncharacterized protein G2W53_004933 [Senna tora]|uniref:Uncharacterized protein n=1 Tax=Senna tora TaxID=362788 RepID=A0A834XCG8_9FABA|nr:uncharacterized protein G2W53_004933 [Senna tora]